MAKQEDETKPHMHDFEGHVRAVEEDLEYYRAKRFEPRVIYMARRGVVTFYDLLEAKSKIKTKSRRKFAKLESHVRALEDALDDYVKGIALASSGLPKEVGMVIEDTRKERGDYDEFFRIRKKEHGGSLKERIRRLEQNLKDYQMLLDVYIYALIQKGYIKRADYNKRKKALYAKDVWNGAKIVARAWLDPEFRADLIERGREAVRELGIPPGRLGKLGVVENTESTHNVVVCTLCSCYPHDLLGDTPWWYKHDSYKKRIIEDPRGTLKKMFSLDVPPHVQISIHDSTSDVRYMVLPRRPPGTGGMKEEELAELVTRDSLIGVAEALRPSQLAAGKKTERVTVYD